MTVIKVTNAVNKEPVLINSALFVTATRVEDRTSFMLNVGRQNLLEIPVKETLDEILRIMRGKK